MSYPNRHVRCNNINLYVTFKYTNIPFLSPKHSSAPGQLCAFNPLPFASTTGTIDDFVIFNFMRQAVAPHHRPPFGENPPSREPKRAGPWVGTHRAPVTE